ncbi:MAG: dTDP-4-dehydrorhamnose 3,5-epimerase [Caulobacteraceae bacterium]
MPVRLIAMRRFGDERGWFSETWNARAYAADGIHAGFVQDNHSLSRDKGVLRGLHFQRPPHAQAKLVRCPRGAIWDVAVDVRKASPTFGHWVGAELSAANGLALFVPEGFAHGFLTLESDTEVHYKVTDFHAPDCEGGVIWNDESLSLPWPTDGAAPILSAKDALLPPLTGFESPFAYEGSPLDRALAPITL